MASILRREGLDGIDPKLDATIQALTLARDACSIPIIRILSDSTGALLISTKVHFPPLRGDRLVIPMIHVV